MWLDLWTSTFWETVGLASELAICGFRLRLTRQAHASLPGKWQDEPNIPHLTKSSPVAPFALAAFHAQRERRKTGNFAKLTRHGF